MTVLGVELHLQPEWIVTLDPADRVLQDHSLVVSAGRIHDILPVQAAAAKYPATRPLALPGCALIPGLINAHTHGAMTLLRGFADDLPLMRWLTEHIWPAEQRWASPAFVRDGTRLALLEMLRGGTTCYNDMYFFPDVTAQCVAEAGMRATIGLILIEFPTPWAQDADEYLHKGLAVHDRYRSDPLVRTAFAPHAPYSVSDASLQRVATLAEELDLPIHMHLHETREEIVQSLREHGKRPLERLEELGLVSPHLVAVHMTQLEPREIETLARHGVHVVHSPESNLKLASGTCPLADQLIPAGINCALGTDGAASNNDLDLLGELRTAALLAKGTSRNPCALPAQAALRLATLGGARALGIEAETGSLEIGKSADLVAVDLSAPETQPVYDPVSQLVYAASRNQVRHVWIAGRQVLRDRLTTTLDEEAILARAAEWGHRIAAHR